MATRTRATGHTAGIFSDMTVDGPEIGTLVVIVDRAKNLPNRKSIGKQDPYCAARLGKEAKKTETDRRGGQTPRWDQELRFTVHDSPDYYQLKVSVFNDDKKTDLIGETWVNLKEVVVPGGGQSDIWHSLNCKGKYAGEIRIEMTYYDTRPKEEKAVKEVKQTNTIPASDEQSSELGLRGPRQPQQKTPVKRRPLPSDPITGVTPPLPGSNLNSPSNPPSVQDHYEVAQRGYSQPQPVPQQVQPSPRGYAAPSGVPAHVQTSIRGQQGLGFIPTQSPLQTMEYNAPSPQSYQQPEPRYTQPDPRYVQPEPAHPQPEPQYQQQRKPQSDPRYHPQSYPVPSHRNEYSQAPRAVTPTPSAHADDRYGKTSQSGGFHGRDDGSGYDARDQYNNYGGSSQSPYEVPHPDDFDSPPSPGGPPPPPPVHRSRHGSAQPSPLPPLSTQSSYGYSNSPQNQFNQTPTHQQHRHSVPDYESQPYDSPAHGRAAQEYRVTPPRHRSYDDRYNHQDYQSMQPTVEDAPSSPLAHNFAASPSYNTQSQQYGDDRYDKVPSPAPLNLSGRDSAASGGYSASSTPSHQYSNNSMNYASSNSQNSFRDRSNTDTTMSSRNSYHPAPQQRPTSQQNQPMRRMSHDPTSTNYQLPPVPSSLVTGMDPMIAQEISDRIYDEKRASHGRPSGQSPRGPYQNTPSYGSSRPHPLSYQEPANQNYDAAPVSPYDDRQGRFAAAQGDIVKPRAISPDPRRISRKSVSPSPGPPPGDETRRLSGVPFGPDSYNALNPTVASSVSVPSLSAKYDPKEVDPDAKIITHDGREVDPSDHIPESNYAPLREVKGPKYASQMPDRNYRPPPSAGSQAGPNAGPRPLRQTGRPQSMGGPSPIHSHQNSAPNPHTPPTGRNRLQKKANRMSAQPASYSSPLAPVTPHQDNSYMPRSQGRGNMTEYSNENFAPQQYGSSPGYRGSYAPPPIPEKIPVQNGPPPHVPGSGDPWALLEEMKSIDLGTGRARRRQY